MRVVEDESMLKDAIVAAQTEAKAAFGNGDVYIEHYIKAPRHIEVQILADTHGNVVSFPSGTVRSSDGIKNWWKNPRRRPSTTICVKRSARRPAGPPGR